MKVALIAVAFTCLVGSLHAASLFENFEGKALSDEFSTFDEVKPQILPEFDEDGRIIRPTPRPTTPRPSPPTTTTRPTKAPRPPQIHHNAIRSQGPLSGRLVNVVQNLDGTQRTVQRNNIQFNYVYANQLRKMLEEALNENEA